MREALLGEMREGFSRTHARLDLLNGRVGKSEVEIGRLQERVKTLFARVFDRRYHERRGEHGDAEGRAITRRDVAVAVGGGAAIVGTIKFLVWIGPALKALAP